MSVAAEPAGATAGTARSSRRAGAVIGAGAAACAVCCAGPILGLLASIGIATAAGVLVFGLTGLLVALVGAVAVVRHRRRVAPPKEPPSVPVNLGVSLRTGERDTSS